MTPPSPCYLVALDLCTPYGEGLLIGNNATLQRLLFEPGAPHAAVAAHVWAHLVIPGNPMTARKNCQWQEDKAFATGVLYFARDHTAGPRRYQWPTPSRPGLSPGRRSCATRISPVATAPSGGRPPRRRRARRPATSRKSPWNLWLAGGTIHTALSLFEKHSQKIDKRQVKRLFNLTGKTPMDLVIQRNTRDELLEVAERSGWRVQPELLAAVRAAIQQYHAGRAPLYPLPEIQRLGYLDEEDAIECKADLTDARRQDHLPQRRAIPAPLRNRVSFSRTVTRPSNFTGEDEELQYSGQELAFLISAHGRKRMVLHGCAGCATTPPPPLAMPSASRATAITATPVDFTLQDLVAHFVIPEVPDVAAVQPEAYSVMVSRLSEIEAVLAA